MTRTCYIAGPMRGLPGYNYPAFHEATKRLREVGWNVISPAELDIEADNENFEAHSMEQQVLHDTASNARRFARRDLRILTDVLKSENGDAVVVLPGHEKSVGARAETAVAKWVFLPIYTVEEAIEQEENTQHGP